MSQKLELLKVRDFGELISDTFVFMRENLKQLLACFFIFCGFFLLAAALFSALQQIKMAAMVNTVVNNNDLFQPRSSFGFSGRFGIFGLEYLLSIVMILINYLVMHVAIYSYVCLYREKGNVPPTTAEVWGYFKYFFFRILGSGIVLTLLLFVASLLCFFPGVYLYPILSLVFPIMIFENTSFGYAFNRSFRLVKNNWWTTFGALFVMGLIVYFASLVIVLPTALLSAGNMFLHLGKGTNASVIIAVITAVLESLCHVFYILPIILVSLCYFSLTEQLDGTGLMSRIAQLGNTEPDTSTREEEY